MNVPAPLPSFVLISIIVGEELVLLQQTPLDIIADPALNVKFCHRWFCHQSLYLL